MTHKGEAKVIAGTAVPLTGPDLIRSLERIGVREGDLVMVHASLGGLGWVAGGVQTVLDALFTATGATGTLVMPGFSSQLSDPANWQNPPVPVDWQQTIREQMPLFDRDRTPTRGLSRLNEAFRALKDTRRSFHPIDSFLAHGLLADAIVDTHPLAPTFGATGPLGRLYDHAAKVLFLGSGFATCTCYHLAEYDNPDASWGTARYPVARRNGVTVWEEVEEIEFDSGQFAGIGAGFEAGTGQVARSGPIRLFDMRAAVDYARNRYAPA